MDIAPPALSIGVERAVQRRLRKMSRSNLDRPLPHRRVTDHGSRGCSDSSIVLGNQSMDLSPKGKSSYSDNVPPSCNEIYDCDLVSSDPARKYQPASSASTTQTQSSTSSTVLTMSTAEAKKQQFLFRLNDGSAIDTSRKLQDRIVFGRVLETTQIIGPEGKVLRYVIINGAEKCLIQESIAWLRDLDPPFEAEFVYLGEESSEGDNTIFP